MQLKRNIQNLKRVQTSINRDLLKGINLDRNEKVDIFQDKLQNTIKKKLTKNIFNSTPVITSLYKKLSNYFFLQNFLIQISIQNDSRLHRKLKEYFFLNTNYKFLF